MIMKKKLLATLLTFLLIFSIIPYENVEAASINKEAGAAYAKVIDRYLEVYKAVKKGYQYYDISLSSDDTLVDGYYYDMPGDIYNVVHEFMTMAAKSDTIVYRIFDFNKDGTPELFLANSKGKIYQAFTYKNGKAVFLMGAFFGNNKCVLCKNGIIERQIEGGAGGNVWIDKISKNKELESVVSLGTYHDGNKMHYTQNKNGNVIELSKTKYNNLIKKYCKPIKLKFYKADNKAVKNIKNGKFTYKNQKSWSIKGKI